MRGVRGRVLGNPSRCTSAHALVATRRRLEPGLAREDAAGAVLAPYAARPTDLGAVDALAGRGAPTARIEGLGRVDAFVAAGAEHDAGKLVACVREVLHGLAVGAAATSHVKLAAILGTGVREMRRAASRRERGPCAKGGAADARRSEDGTGALVGLGAQLLARLDLAPFVVGVRLLTGVEVANACRTYGSEGVSARPIATRSKGARVSGVVGRTVAERVARLAAGRNAPPLPAGGLAGTVKLALLTTLAAEWRKGRGTRSACGVVWQGRAT